MGRLLSSPLPGEGPGKTRDSALQGMLAQAGSGLLFHPHAFFLFGVQLGSICHGLRDILIFVL